MLLEKPRGLLSNIPPALGIYSKISTTVQRVRKKRKKEIAEDTDTLSETHSTTEHVVFRCGFDVDLQFFFIGIRWEVLAIVVSKKMWWELPHILLVMVSILEGGRKKMQRHTRPRTETKLGRSRITKLHGN